MMASVYSFSALRCAITLGFSFSRSQTYSSTRRSPCTSSAQRLRAAIGGIGTRVAHPGTISSSTIAAEIRCGMKTWVYAGRVRESNRFRARIQP